MTECNKLWLNDTPSRRPRELKLLGRQRLQERLLRRLLRHVELQRPRVKKTSILHHPPWEGKNRSWAPR
jgi:hypothetical protein